MASVLLVLPYRSFDLDRFFAPKELALHAAALVAGLAALAAARRFTVSRADIGLIAWLAASVGSALPAANHTLAFRAVAVTVSGAAVFWTARRLAGAGLAPALTRILAAAVVAGALTALAQAYGVRWNRGAQPRAGRHVREPELHGAPHGRRDAAGPLVHRERAEKTRCGALDGRARALLGGARPLTHEGGVARARGECGARRAGDRARTGAAREPVARRRFRRALAAVAAGVVLALALPNSLDWRSDSPYLDSVKGVVDYREGSGRGRLAQYANSMKMARIHPLLGVGPGNWPVWYPHFAPPGDPSLSDATGMAANPWPSSDWVAALSERGFGATVGLAAFVILLLVAAARTRRDPAAAPDARLAAVAGGGVVLIAAIEGGFDAVLLLPTPLLLVMAAAGALIATGPNGRERLPRPAQRVMLTAGFTAVMLAACWTGARRISAMKLYEAGTPAAIEAAALTDPGSYRIQMRAAEFFAARANCAKAKAHAAKARDLFPFAPGPRRVLAQCR